MLDGGLSEFVLAKGTYCSQRTSPPQLVTAAWGHQYQFYDVRVCAKLVELFDGDGVSFVSVTQQFNTTTSMGRLTLNVLLSFAQFEREVTSERIRDKIAASKRKGLWVGGMVPLGGGGRARSGHLPALSRAWQPPDTQGRSCPGQVQTIPITN
jgi:Resolvase, N terminal domain